MKNGDAFAHVLRFGSFLWEFPETTNRNTLKNRGQKFFCDLKFEQSNYFLVSQLHVVLGGGTFSF